jgi:putative ABC transport system permease protein
MQGALRDVRFAVRALLRTPILFAAAVLTLAAGTGLATGVFAVAYGVLLRPLPYPDAERLVTVSLFFPAFENREVGILLPEVHEWQRRTRVFHRLSAYSTGDFTLRGAGDPRSVRGTMVTDGFFEALGDTAAEGSSGDLSARRDAVALSARLTDQIGRRGPWRERGVTIGARDFSVAAIMPPEFTFPNALTDLWVRADAVPQITLFAGRDQRRFTLVGRLSPGVTVAQAIDDVKRVVREVDAASGAVDRQLRDATIRPVDEWMRRGGRAAVLPFLAGAALVLVIACANVSGLLVGRAVARQREFAVRRALGGGLTHIFRASMAESLTVSLLGWGVGLWIASLVILVFESRAAAAIPNLQAVHLDAPVVIVSFALAVLVALAAGAPPALRAARSDPNTALKQTSERVGRGGLVFRGALVVGQIALTVVLLVAAGLLMRTVLRIVAVERGFDARDATSMRLMLTQTNQFNAIDRAPFISRLVERARALPGVVAAGVSSDLPPEGTQITITLTLVADNVNETHTLGYAAATHGYLEAIGATLISGRTFAESDRFADAPVAVITESAARAVFRKDNPVGREWPAPMPTASGKRVKPRIIGIVKDIKYGGLDRSGPALTLFTPWEHLAPGSAHLVVRTAGPSTAIGAELRRVVQEMDATLPLFTPQTLDDVVSASIADRRLRLQLAAAFATLALVLAGVALWGAVAQSVLDRRHELAVRLALGATSGDAVTLMLRAGLLMIGLGVAIGGAAGAAASRALRHLLHGVSPFDPLTFAVGLGVAALVSLVACYVPARRAASVSPAELLRET